MDLNITPQERQNALNWLSAWTLLVRNLTDTTVFTERFLTVLIYHELRGKKRSHLIKRLVARRGRLRVDRELKDMGV